MASHRFNAAGKAVSFVTGRCVGTVSHAGTIGPVSLGPVSLGPVSLGPVSLCRPKPVATNGRPTDWILMGLNFAATRWNRENGGYFTS